MRRNVSAVVGCLFLILCAAAPCAAKAWRGIVPLHSTRADVIKILGEPKHLQWDYADYFILKDEIVTFSWIDPSCVRKYPVEPDSEVRQGDLVLGITVTPKKPVPYESLGLPRVEEDNPSAPLKLYFFSCVADNDCIFTDDEEGFAYSMGKEGVTFHTYRPPAAERQRWMQEHAACKPTR